MQSLNDFLVFGSMAIGSFGSGKVLALYGWATVNEIVFPVVIIAAVICSDGWRCGSAARRSDAGRGRNFRALLQRAWRWRIVCIGCRAIVERASQCAVPPILQLLP